MRITVTYSSLRREIWSHYVHLWKQALWRVHLKLFTAITVGLMLLLSIWHRPITISIAVAIAGGFLACILLALYPLARFKPQVRKLTIDDSGLETWIGTQHGSVGWHDVASIADQNDLIVILRTNGNAFVVPQRAFATPADRATFLTTARDAWSKTKP